MQKGFNIYRWALGLSLLIHAGIIVAAYGGLDTPSNREMFFQSAASLGPARISVEQQRPQVKPRDPAENGLRKQDQAAGSGSRFSSDVLRKNQSSIQNRLRYPELAQEYGWEGRVRIGAMINAAGRAQDLKVLKSSGHKILDRAALKGVAAHGFPAGSGRESVSFTFIFKLQDPDE